MTFAAKIETQLSSTNGVISMPEQGQHILALHERTSTCLTSRHLAQISTVGNSRPQRLLLEQKNVQVNLDCGFQQQRDPVAGMLSSLQELAEMEKKNQVIIVQFEQHQLRHLCSSGDRVALVSANCGPLLEAILAILGLGAVAVPLNTRWNPQEVSAALSLCAPVLVLVQQDLHGLLVDYPHAAKVSFLPDARKF